MIYQNQRGTLFSIFGATTFRLLHKKPESPDWEPVSNVRNCWTSYGQAIQDIADLAEIFGLEKVHE